MEGKIGNVSKMSDLLPLRLYAEPLARERLGGACFVLPSKHEAEACLVVNDQGLVAVALESEADAVSIARILEVDEVCVPNLTLCRGKGWRGESQPWGALTSGGQC